ncbi:hypothetical protein M5D96_011099, partial [Drosophila gunungcola]
GAVTVAYIKGSKPTHLGTYFPAHIRTYILWPYRSSLPHRLHDDTERRS